MRFRDAYRSAKEKIGSLFSRRGTETIQSDERGRNAQVGYQQRRTWFDRTLDAIGSAAKYVGFSAAVLTGIGAIALGTQYIRGRWPYADVPRNEFVITRNAITEKPARPLKQGVNAYVTPFVTIVEENGRPVTVSGEMQSAETPEFVYRSKEGASIKLKVQYNYQVASPEGAAKAYWDYGGLEKARESLDTIIENTLMGELAKVPAKDVAGETRIASAGEKYHSNKGKIVTAKGGEEINILVEAEHRANAVLGAERSGVVVTNFSISNPVYDANVQAAFDSFFEIGAAENRAKARVHKEVGEAQARLVKAHSEAQEAEILKNATLGTIDGYFAAGQRIANATGQPQRAAEYAMALHERDNTQQIANSGSRIIYAPHGLGIGNPIAFQNIGQTNPPANEPPKRVNGVDVVNAS